MPEENEQTSEQQTDFGTEETVDETATEEAGGTEQQETAQEAQSGGEEKPFDRKKFEAELRKKNSEAANLRKRLKELEPLAQKAKEFEDAQKSETERLTEQLTRANEQIAATRKSLVEARVQALAGTQSGERAAFTDPEDAVGSLDLTSYIDESGSIDEAAIEADLQALLERKPHWAKTQPQEGPRRPAPDRTQASGANKKQAPNPREEFAAWFKPRL
ncbi:small-conductance mechanosensitive channel [Streptomyces ambofaciens]